MIVTMKKYILAMLLGCLFLASCNETDCSYLNEFKLVESTTNYSAKACSGYILYDGGQGDAVVTATSSEAWCKVSADASKVYISLDDNYSIDSRTAMVTLTCGNQTKRVPVTQLGRVTEFSEDTIFYSCDNSAVGVDYKARNPFSFEVSGLPDWISYTASEDGVHFDIAANETGEYRKASAVVKAINTDMVQTVNFVQYSLFGDWIAVYEDMLQYDEEKDEFVKDTLKVKVALNRADSLVTITGLCNTPYGNFPLVGKLTKDGSYELINKSVVGNIKDVFNVVQYALTSEGEIYTDAPYTYKCAFDANKKVCTFYDNNGLKDVEFVGFLISAINSKGEDAADFTAISNLKLYKSLPK